MATAVAVRSNRILLALLAALVLGGCASIPFDYPKQASEAVAPGKTTSVRLSLV